MGRRTGPRLINAGGAGDPLVVVRSDFWGYNGLAVFDGDEVALIDPGIRPEEIALLRAVATTRLRGSEPPRRVSHVLITHSHHDHIRGWASAPGAEVVMPRVAATKPADARERIVTSKVAIDDHLGVEEAEFAYPSGATAFDESIQVAVGRLEVELRFLPGHSNCTSVVWIPTLRTLLSADYLVSPGLPYCRWQARPFEEALETLKRWTRDEGIERVWPAHNDPLLGQDAILAAIDADLEAMARTREAVRRGVDAGDEDERIVIDAAKAVDAARDWDPGKQRRQDRDNARRVLAEERT